MENLDTEKPAMENPDTGNLDTEKPAMENLIYNKYLFQ